MTTYIIGCGATKSATAAPAHALYIGSKFRSALAAARAAAGDQDTILILSARHGLVPLDRVLEPYDQRMDEPGAVATATITTTFRAHGDPSAPVVAFLAAAYYAALRDALTVLGIQPLNPYRHTRGIGGQNAVDKRWRNQPAVELARLTGAPTPPDRRPGPVNLSYPVDALVSYHYFRDDRVMDKITAGRHLRLIGDSGAFSAYSQGATITLTEYAAWCHRWADHLMWRASLDVIGDPVASLANWRALRDAHGLDTIPTIHVGTDPSWIGAYATQGVDFIGLGGMVGKSVPVIRRWSVAMLRYARDHYPQVRFHAWGQAGRTYLDALPVYSADSSRSAVAYRYGILRLFDPATGAQHNLKLNGSPAVNRYGRLLRGVYGVDPADVRTSHEGNRRLLIRLAAAGIQQYAAWLQARHQVTAPTYGMRDAPPVGPLVHNVSVVPRDYVALYPDTDPEGTP